MGGLNAALSSGKTSMQANQKSIEITGLNIVNVDTPGYSRQTPNLAPYPALNTGDFFVGRGVTVESILRSHDVFLAGQISDKSADKGVESAMSSPLAEVERVLGIGEGSLAYSFDQYFDSIRQLSTNPGGEVERQLVLQQGALISDAFSTVITELQSAQNNINATLTSKIDGVNQTTAEIADLNVRISAIEQSGQVANSDRDRRDLLLKNLSESIGAVSYETSNGNASVTLPNGMPLVEADRNTLLEGYPSGADVALRLKFGSTDLNLDKNALGGEFRGLYEVRDVLMPDLTSRLDQLAYSFASEVNTQHQAGTGLDGVSGRDFFTPITTVAGAASSLSVNLTSTAQLAAGTSAAPGDNTNIINILGLEQAQTIGGDNFVSYYGKITATIGIEAARNKTSLTGLEDSLVQLENLRDGIDGVSLEEEMINLLKYQNAFEASAKFLSTVDEMMATMLALKR